MGQSHAAARTDQSKSAYGMLTAKDETVGDRQFVTPIKYSEMS